MLIFATITKIGTRVWRFTWSGTSPYRVYYKGKLLATTTDTEYTLEADDANNIAYPPRLILQWRLYKVKLTYPSNGLD
jgi:hypothetical protein